MTKKTVNKIEILKKFTFERRTAVVSKSVEFEIMDVRRAGKKNALLQALFFFDYCLFNEEAHIFFPM